MTCRDVCRGKEVQDSRPGTVLILQAGVVIHVLQLRGLCSSNWSSHRSSGLVSEALHLPHINASKTWIQLTLCNFSHLICFTPRCPFYLLFIFSCSGMQFVCWSLSMWACYRLKAFAGQFPLLDAPPPGAARCTPSLYSDLHFTVLLSQDFPEPLTKHLTALHLCPRSFRAFFPLHLFSLAFTTVRLTTCLIHLIGCWSFLSRVPAPWRQAVVLFLWPAFHFWIPVLWHLVGPYEKSDDEWMNENVSDSQ